MPMGKIQLSKALNRHTYSAVNEASPAAEWSTSREQFYYDDVDWILH